MDNSKVPRFGQLGKPEILFWILRITLGFVVAACFLLAHYYYFGENANSSSDVHTPDWHTMRDMVVCIDKLSSDKNSTYSNERKPVHFVFIGDSRIRQHFLNFFKVKKKNLPFQ
jgi:hypothetical protein